MSLSDLLQPDDSSPKKPSRSREEDSNDDDQAAKKTAASASLSRRQQEFLREEREELTSKMREILRAVSRTRKRFFTHMVGHVHRGRWRDFHPFFEQLRAYGVLSKRGLVVFGGWHQDFAATDMVKPPRDFMETVRAYAIFKEYLRRVQAHRDSVPANEQAALNAIWPWIESHFDLFKDVVQLEDFDEIIKEEAADLEKIIRSHLLYLEGRALVFFPSANDPASGWKDFFDFVWAYDFLPDSLKDSYGSYHFLIRLPSSSIP